MHQFNSLYPFQLNARNCLLMLSAYLNEVKEFARSDDVYNNSEAYMLQ